MFDTPYVTKVAIDVCRRAFYLHSDQGDVKEVLCDTPKEFINILEFLSICPEFNIEVVYVSPLIADDAGVV